MPLQYLGLSMGIVPKLQLPLDTTLSLCQVTPWAPHARPRGTPHFLLLSTLSSALSQQDCLSLSIFQRLHSYLLSTLLSTEPHIESNGVAPGAKLGDGLHVHKITLPSPWLRLCFRAHWLDPAFSSRLLSLRRLGLPWSVLWTECLCPP